MAFEAQFLTLIKSEPIGTPGPCFSSIPKGSIHVLLDFSNACNQSEAVNSSHFAGIS